MPRTHWLILAIGVAVMLFFSLAPDQRRPVTESLLPDTEPGTHGLELGEPDLLLEGAVITQFRLDGSLQYRLHAVRIAHFPGMEQTVLTEPRLLLDQGAAAPWELSSLRGRIIGGSGGLLETGSRTERMERTGAERVELEDDVRIHRQRSPERFIDLTTSALTLFPEHEYAETNRPVIISTEAGRTTAASLRADLATGRILLASAGEDRVHTTLTPERLP
ncbi:MAG: LPS export ABC transporter periplasmic protein LptC [Gammaproteobacteria bacterium]|nr:MAG: LPS export ABC transporter periplasmic protein LptC [Gammaproteobacteria bacterium]